MLISLKTKSVERLAPNEYKLNVDIPAIYLDSLKYTVSIRHILIKLKAYVLSDIFCSLRTTAIDRNSFNPEQEIFSFHTLPASNYISCEPYHLREYIIQRHQVHSSEFTLRVDGQDLEKFEPTSVEFIVELKRDARFQ